jgi:DNA-binding transcriptional regulator YdaS (Cro superfamily)
MIGNPIQMRAVERAVEIAEGIEALAACLGVPPVAVAAWIQGTSEVPPAPFLKVVEIIVEYGGHGLRGSIPSSLVETFRHRPAANN